ELTGNEMLVKFTDFVDAFFFSGGRRHTIWPRDWSSDVCSSDLRVGTAVGTRYWWRITVIGIVPGILISWTIANVPLESLSVGDWLRSLAWAVTALASPVVAAVALASGATAPTFAQMLGRAAQRPREVAAFG